MFAHYDFCRSCWEDRSRGLLDAQRFSVRFMGICLLMLLPASVVLLAHPLLVIATLFQRGAFDAKQTALTAPLLAIYALGVPAMGVSLLGGRILLSR